MLKNYWKPTPKKWRQVGDFLLAISTLVSLGGMWQFDALKDFFTTSEIKNMIMLSISSGVVGKFLTNFFSDEPAEN